MEQKVVIPAVLTERSFECFLFRNRKNRMMLWLSMAAIVFQFLVFKYFYPFASFIHGDSFVYIETANQNLDINTYLVGYSRFLRIISVFTTSDTALVALQYLMIQTSALLLLFTVFYFYNPANVIQTVLICFIVMNPLFLYLANLISSDCLFTTLSLIWLSLLIWIVHRPSGKIVVAHAFLLFAAFTVRYNALIYPFISAVAFSMSSLSFGRKVTGLALGFILCGLFIFYTGSKYRQLTGIWQYSPFSGWQIANNAMYAYRYVDKTSRKPVQDRFKSLDNMIRVYFDSTRDVKRFWQEEQLAGTWYMWDKKLTLYKYMYKQFERDSLASGLKKWASMGPFYRDYGIYIIKQYPWYYVRFFLWPNFNKYYSPPVEFLSRYNSGKTSVPFLVQQWFHYKDQKVSTRMNDLEFNILEFYPIYSGVINVLMLCGLVCYFMTKDSSTSSLIPKSVLLGAILWFFNAAFTIAASSAALRFQSFPIVATTIFSLLQLDWIWKVESLKSKFVDSKHAISGKISADQMKV